MVGGIIEILPERVGQMAFSECIKFSISRKMTPQDNGEKVGVDGHNRWQRG